MPRRTRATVPKSGSPSPAGSALEGRHELAPGKVEVAREGVGHRVGGSRDVVVARHVAVEALVRTEHAQEVRGDLVRRGAPLPLPEQGVEVVGLAECSAFPDVKRLGKSLEME